MAGFWVKISETRSRWYKSEEDFKRQTGIEIPKTAYVQDDTMDATWHPATGQTLESRSEFRKMTKAAGCVELGDADLNPGPKEIKIDSHAIGKELWDLMESNNVDYRDIRRQIIEDLNKR